WDDGTSWKVLQEGFATTGHDVADCHGVLVTHVHPDHHGLSGRVRDASAAWIAMHELDSETAEHLSTRMDCEHTRGDPAEQSSPDFNDELVAALLDAGATESELT